MNNRAENDNKERLNFRVKHSKMPVLTHRKLHRIVNRRMWKRLDACFSKI